MKRGFSTWTMLGLLSLAATACGSENPELKPKQLAEQNKPGTVMIQAMHKAEIAVPDYTINDEKVAQLQQALWRQFQAGKIDSEAQAVAAAFQEILTKPIEYLQPTEQPIRRQTEATTSGTGSILTEDGYVVTNAHVVSSEDSDLKKALALEGLKDVTSASCEEEWNELDGNTRSALGQTIGTEEFMQLCREGLVQYYAHYMELSQVDTKIYTAIGALPPDEDITKKGYLSEVAASGKPTPGKDVAILKINAKNLPTVQIGDDKGLNTGDPVYILGYPAAANISETKANEVSLTSGLVSARKTMPDDWDVLQTDAAMSHGNSGGPVLNNQGQMIGLATFGKVDQKSGETVQGVNFIVPVTVVQEFLTKINVQPQESPLSIQYRQGIALFEAQHYRQALDKFRKIQELNADFPYVQTYISESRAAIDAGRDRSFTWVYLAAPAALVTAGLGFWMVKRLAKRRQPLAAGTEQPLNLVSSIQDNRTQP
jgi:serine protease Do